jgi:hypothetical protein
MNGMMRELTWYQFVIRYGARQKSRASAISAAGEKNIGDSRRPRKP